MSMTFDIGKATLKDGTPVRFPRENIVPGQPVTKTADGKPLANGTYENPKKPGTSFTVKDGKVAQIDLPTVARVVEVIKEPVKIEPEVAKEPEKLPVVETTTETVEKEPASVIEPEVKPAETVVVPEVVVTPVV